MQKLKLSPEKLAVESFPVQKEMPQGGGTVRGHDLTLYCASWEAGCVDETWNDPTCGSASCGVTLCGGDPACQ